ncbi:MAG: hypothetical protein KC419_10025 [Anaerolineales bacterium]|nr:hypothetical protein [Anaerolineales bacterium]MCA9928806.1 hypothetical protein [Anaerolineales bacterium]
MKETTTYEFWTLDGRHLGNITTDDPFAHVGELSHHYGIDADEIEWFEYDPAAWE